MFLSAYDGPSLLASSGYAALAQAALLHETALPGQALVLEAGDSDRISREVARFVDDVASATSRIDAHNAAKAAMEASSKLAVGLALASALTFAASTVLPIGAIGSALTVLSLVGAGVAFVSAASATVSKQEADALARRLRLFRDRLVAAEHRAPEGEVRERIRSLLRRTEDALVSYADRNDHAGKTELDRLASSIKTYQDVTTALRDSPPSR